ncbi:hypothetical protein [Flavivirga spongiicola]|uniref:Uncharacterized protein n=1 Tax=Flavivirga spongiicola TaxID=421621 RepID=A0ABU7XPN3_9FLAO|nr:hypothetical protein [Flavivirga sp. MEBiC05379]MDO5977723.1 hypothetical protein [Flavivirga sp. MEBiC05379]
MKKFIYKTNQYLLENHPIIWNTKLFWVASASLILHILFFIFGLLAITNPEILHEYGAKSIFFENGTIFISIILSILILVIWLIFLFKNNAFKNFYPTSKLKLFKQFLIYLIITFLSTTFYISYNFGVKSYISFKYDDKSIEKEIAVSNAAALFFSKSIEDYTINQRRYPHPFNTLYCETYEGSDRDNDRLYLSFLDYKYRFYTLYKKEGALYQELSDSTYRGFVFYKTKDTIRTYFYKDSIFDASSFVQTTNPNYFNYSKIFYLSKKERLKYDNIQYGHNEYNEYEYYNYQQDFTKNNALWNKAGYDLLNRNNSDEIKQILADFLMISDAYEIEHNLTTGDWFNMVYHPNDNFELKKLIRDKPKGEIQFEAVEPKTAMADFYKKHITDYYLDTDSLYKVFDNIEDIKESNPFSESIHFFIWFAFFFSALVFMFRSTGLKPLLFTIISIGILVVFVTLLTVFYTYVNKYNQENTQYFASYLTFILSTIILSIPIFYAKRIKKLIVAICLNISIIGFVLYVFLIITIISLHQSDACIRNYSFYTHNKDCFNLLKSIGIYWSYILFIINLLFIYIYSGVIKKWKALPEG